MLSLISMLYFCKVATNPVFTGLCSTFPTENIFCKVEQQVFELSQMEKFKKAHNSGIFLNFAKYNCVSGE